ncbi:hypothetical protein C095_00275 [Fusobacterium necrophorum subsp. funduliforme B35]|uniref:Uncharacterized protein n=1 Tax=Fusobacterium necrophorum subsp. funduliforme B35 TaxID=1226633 RepID=A0A0B4ELH1_9FUSO|nr:hypothetical protein C095_00275 [Fusobacterium necrophorum subsp. funduliforme B35]
MKLIRLLNLVLFLIFYSSCIIFIKFTGKKE